MQYIPPYLRHVENNILILIDTLHPDEDSLTNSIAHIIPMEYSRLGEDFQKLESIIYRDSTKTYDGVYYDCFGCVRGFYPIQEKDLDRAIDAARRHRRSHNSAKGKKNK